MSGFRYTGPGATILPKLKKSKKSSDEKEFYAKLFLPDFMVSGEKLCNAIKQDGDMCSNKAKYGTKCGIHRKK